MGDNEAPKGPPDIAGLYSLKLDNVDFLLSGNELREMFVKYGEVGDVYVPRDHLTKQNRGFAFVRFKDRNDAEASFFLT
jgi:arginine/serine-rich splicing factor 2